MRAGPLRERIAIQNPFTGRDELGAPKRDWMTIWECAAHIQTVSGREYFTGEREEASALIRIYIRYPPRSVNINAECRALDLRHGITYGISAVLFDARRSICTLACFSGTSDG